MLQCLYQKIDMSLRQFNTIVYGTQKIMCRPERKRSILKSHLIKKFSAIFILMFVLTACTEDTAEKSNVDGVSDDVYEQLVQHYFNAQLTMDLITGETSDELKKDENLYKDHELYAAAEKYARENGTHPMNIFPNPLIAEYKKDPDQFNETEQAYIEKMNDFITAINRVEHEKYERLKERLKEDLKIKDAYNIF